MGSRLEHRLVSWEANHLGPAARACGKVLDDLHNAASQVQRVGQEMERTASRARAIVDVVGREVERTTDHARSAIDLVETAFHQVKNVGVGIGNGLRMLLPFSRSKRASSRARQWARAWIWMRSEPLDPPRLHGLVRSLLLLTMTVRLTQRG